jgi:regulator of cell morphogenesis and NO signaling
MLTIDIHDTVGALVARKPSLSRVFEEAGLDYCCGGKRPLEEACKQKGLDPAAFAARLEQEAAKTDDNAYVDAAAMSLAQLADHIEQTHHAYLKRELPRLDFLTHKVSSVDGEHDWRLHEIRRIFQHFGLEVASSPQAFHCGSIANPIRQMELEHHGAGDALEQFRALTDGFVPPEWACNTYRALVDALAHLERDMHQHVHKEDNVLFPRALQREAELAAA